MDLARDDVRQLFSHFVVPAIGSAVAVAGYSLVDSIAIGQGVGANGAAACAIVLPIFSIANFIALLCGIGGSVLMNRARGEGDAEKGRECFTSALVLVMILAVVAWVAGCLFQDGFYCLCGADAELMPYAKDYGSLIFAFLPSFVATAFFGCFVRADGSPRFSFASTLVGGGVNIFGDWIFVFPLGMGMKGAAIATVLGSLTQASLLIGFILLGKTALALVRPRALLSSLRKIAGTGFGAGLGALAVIALSLVANNQIMTYADANALAVYGMLGTVAALFTSIFSGVGQGAQPIASESFGAGIMGRCRTVGWLGVRTAVALGAVFAAASIAFPVELTGLFIKMTPEIEDICPFIVKVFSLSYLPQAVSVFAIYYLQSVAHPKAATAVSLLRGIIFSGTFLLAFPVAFGPDGIWWAFFTAEAATALVAIFFFIRSFGRQ